MSRVQPAVAGTPIDHLVHEQGAEAGKAQFRPADPDRFDLDELKPKGSATPGELSNVETGHLTFHGGTVLHSPDILPVYLGPYWQSPRGAADRARNDEVMAALVKDPGQTGIWRQYRGGPGTTSPSKVLSAVNRATFTKSDVEALVEAQVRAGTFDASDPERIFTLVLPPGAVLRDGDISSRNGLGGFHGNVTAPDGHPVYYAVVAYSERTGKSVNGIDFTGRPMDNVSICESHEITEAVTDPDVGLAITHRDARYLGWYDDTTPVVRRDGTPVLDGTGRPMVGKGEIGDIPVLNAELEGDTRLRTVWGRRSGVAVQTEWSNQDGKAELTPARAKGS